MNKNTTKVQFEKDAKYLKFLADLYVKASKGFVKVSVSQLAKDHKVDSVAVQALSDLGWMSKMTTGMVYWRAAFPNDDMAQQIREKIKRIKQAKKTSTLLTKPPLSPTGKRLIPIIKTSNETTKNVAVRTGAEEPTSIAPSLAGIPERFHHLLKPDETTKPVIKIAMEVVSKDVSSPRVVRSGEVVSSSSTTQRYYNFINELYLTLQKGEAFHMASLVTKNKLNNCCTTILQELKVLKKVGYGSGWTWSNKTITPTIQLADEVRVLSNRYSNSRRKKEVRKSKPLVTKDKVVTETVEVIIPKQVAKTKNHPTGNLAPAPKANSQTDLKKSIALKLIELGELEKANELLNQII